MKTRLLPVTPENLRRAVEILQNGGLAALPTDTVYGVGALAFDGEAVESIYTAKGRSPEKAIPVLIADPSDLPKVTASVPEMARRLATHFWPGPLTLVVPRHPNLPAAVSSTGTVGVRIPAHEAARALLRLAGPMAITSANISGGSSPSTAEAVMEQLGGRIQVVLDGGKTPGGLPSTVVDCTGPELQILREGPITLTEILSFLIG